MSVPENCCSVRFLSVQQSRHMACDAPNSKKKIRWFINSAQRPFLNRNQTGFANIHDKASGVSLACASAMPNRHQKKVRCASVGNKCLAGWLNSGPDRSGREKRDRICLVLQIPAPRALNACHVKISVPDRKPPQIHTVFCVDPPALGRRCPVPWRQRRVAAARGGGRRRIPWDERGRSRGPKRVLFMPNSRQIPQR